MKLRSCLLLALACCAAIRPSVAAAQANDATPRDWPAPPIIALLGQRERLSLTSEQVAALDSIAQAWSRENDRLNPGGTIMTSGPLGVSVSRGPTKSRTPEAAANNLRTARALEQVLDSAQRETVCALKLAPADRRDRSRPVWPWCVETASPAR
jgi:hypothetical protein